MIPIDIKIKSIFYNLINYQKKYGYDDLTINLAKGEIEKNYSKSIKKKKLRYCSDEIIWKFF